MDIVLSGRNGTLGLDNYITLDDVNVAKRLLKELNLEKQMNYAFDMLSKGERQNVLIARALISKPDILILDEPCTGLDIYHRSYLFDTIEELSKRKNLTIIYVTHYVEEITPLFQKSLLLKNGHIFAKGSTSELFTNEVLHELLGYPVVIEKGKDETYQLKMKTRSSLVDLLM